ncbi:MAG: phosphatase [Clostridia bacterium]|nr:phosphatase [Clostridia bacterium]NCC44798.1 phosphatase [Clostridia bacterium]
MQFDIHTHTIASGHGTSCTITDMAKAAKSKGLSLIGITDHGPATFAAGTPSYFRSLLMAPHLRCGVQLLYGIELNILDDEGHVDLEDDILSRLDYAIASMHIQNHAPGTQEENTKAYQNAMKHPKVKVIGHCDDVKYPVDYESLVLSAKENHVLLELNESSLSPSGYRGDTRQNNASMLYWCQKSSQPIILSSDSHGPEGVGDFTRCLEFVKEQNFPRELILNYRLNDLLSYLK